MPTFQLSISSGKSSASRVWFNLALRTLLVTTLLFGFCWVSRAQNVQRPSATSDFTKRSDLRVDPSSLGLNIEIPLGNYPGRGGSDLSIVLNYSSKIHEIKFKQGPEESDFYSIWAEPNWAENSSAGWTHSLAVPFITSVGAEWYTNTGVLTTDCFAGCWLVRHVSITMPDGSSHDLRHGVPIVNRPGGQPFPSYSGLYYAIDGSQLRYDFDPKTIYLPDGSRYVLGEPNPTVFYDRNGNKQTHNPQNGIWTDTIGRNIRVPFTNFHQGPLSLIPTAPGDYPYTLDGVGSSSLNYTFRWKLLGNALSPPQSLLPLCSETNPNNPGANYPGPWLFYTGYPDSVACGDGSGFNPLVLAEIILPTTQSYKFSYNAYGEIDKIVYPSGGYERYRYEQIQAADWMRGIYAQANRGVVERWTSPKGDGSDESHHHWTYSASYGPNFSQPYKVIITAPDLTRMERSLYCATTQDYPFGFRDLRTSRPYEERFYSSSNQLLRRSLTKWTASSQNGYANARDPHLDKQVEITFDTGSNALAQVTTNVYDTSQNVTSITTYDFKELDPTTAQTVTVDDPNLFGSLLRTDETIYLVNDPAIDSGTRNAYGLRNLIALPSETRVTGPSGMVAQTLLRYDEYSFIPSGATIYWQDPANDKRGNLTSSSNWVNTNGTYVSTRVQFDQYGNVRKTFDARDTGFANPAQFEYSSNSQFAYPTITTSSVPDTTGVHGSNTSFVTTTVYDFNTGVILSTIDANGQTTTFTYNDSLNRPKTVATADGGLITYNYTDTAGSVSVEKVTKLTATQNSVSKQYFDGLGRPNRSFVFVGGSSYITDNVEYDNMGRRFHASNSYFSNGAPAAQPPAGTWTTTVYDDVGRVKTVTTPDNSVTTSTYSATLILVNDPSGKQRISKTNAIGQLTDVWEITPNDPTQYAGIEAVTFAGQTLYGFRTRYEYNGLGSLSKVMQGPQPPQQGAQPARTFSYNSLKQLLSSTNPENGTVTFLYDNNGNITKKTDARGVAIDYTYDWLNRNTRAVSSNDPAGTPTSDSYYDGFRDGNSNANIPNSKGHLWQIGTSGAIGPKTTFDELDALGRPKSKSQQFFNGSWGYRFTTRRTYNLAGALVSQRYPSGRTVTYTYDAAGRIASLSGTVGDGVQRTYASNISYNEAGRLKEEQFGTQIPLYHKLHYNIRGQLNDIRISTASWSADEWNWNRGAIVNYYASADLTCQTAQCRFYGGTDNNGNLRQSQYWVPANDQMNPYNWTEDRFAYDALNRLKSVAEFHGSPSGLSGQDFIQVYDYDRFGNRTINQNSTQGNGVPKPYFAVDPATNRLIVPGGQSGNMHYDASGNLDNDSYSSFGSSDGTPTRTYDSQNRLTVVKNGSQQLVSNYTYNGEGQRVRRSVSGTETWQVYGMDGELLAEYRANAVPMTPTKEYAYRNGQLLTTITNGDDQRLKRFVENLYYGALQRDPNSQEMAIATADLANAGLQSQSQLLTKARDIARSLFAQTNYESTKNEPQYVSDLYYAYLQRAADSSGLGWWAPQAVGGTTNRINVLNAFEGSGEFQALVANLYGTSTGDNQRTENLINNFYLGAYGRFATSTELQQQRDRLNNKAAEGLWPVQSEAETMGRELLAAQVMDYGISDGQYVTNLYESFLQRGPDSGGLGFWTSIAAGGSSHRQNVLNAFATCGPFRDLAGSVYREVYWLVPDHLGTTRMVATRLGNLASVKRHDYLPFGEELGLVAGRMTAQGYSQVDNIRQRFTDKERDSETGLDYFGARYYASIQGRFTSVDPSRKSITAGNPQSWNRYAYALNNPLVYVDENGKWPTWIHELIIDRAFQGLSDSQRQKIKDGSYSVDDPLTGGQDESRSNEHGMAVPGQTPEEAAEKADNFINTNVDKAKELNGNGNFNTSLCYFGKAFHTVSDMTSPAHEGYQVWHLSQLSIHMDTEKLISNYRMGLAVGATLNLYKYIYRSEALKKAMGGYTPGSGNDPSVMAIRRQYSLPGSNFQEESFARAQYRRGLREGLVFDWGRQRGQRGMRVVE